MPKSKVLTSWDQVYTEDQQKRLVLAVCGEIKKLRKSPALAKLLHSEITLATYNAHEASVGMHKKAMALNMTREGEMYFCVINVNPKWAPKPERVSGDRLHEFIRRSRLLPKTVVEIRERIEA